MPSKTDDTPKPLTPYIFHGIDLDWSAKDTRALGDCPWCGRSAKFSVDLTTGQWRCLVCNEGSEKGGGNAYSFIRLLHAKSQEASTVDDYEALAEERKLIDPSSLQAWGLAKSVITDNWLVPGWNVEHKLTGLYQYLKLAKRMALLPTPTLGQHLLGGNLFDPDKDAICICEGVWDCVSLWECLGKAKLQGEKVIATNNPKASLRATHNVLGIPGNLVFSESWLPLFAGKQVTLMCQNDHAREHPKTGEEVAPASLSGMKRIAGMLHSSDEPPSEINYLYWGEDGFDPDLPHGYDIRDHLTSTGV